MSEQPIPILVWPRLGLKTFEQQRVRLVPLIDALVQKSRSRPTLLLDHAALLTDYLHVRPESRRSIKRLLTQGALQPSPWYAPPVLALASPESLIRNLALGTATLERLRAPHLAFTLLPSDGPLFAQLPQILAGFGVEHAVMPTDAIAGHLAWYAPDGSGVTLFTMGGEAPSSIAIREPEHISVLQNHRIAPHALSEMLNAYDLSEMHGSLHPMAGHTASARPSLKQYNHYAQTLLERWMEPLGVWGRITQGESSLSTRDVHQHLWRLLLHNQSGLHGAISDRAYEEAIAGMTRVVEVADDVITEGLTALIAHIDTQPPENYPEAVPVLVYNPHTRPQTGIVTVALPFEAQGVRVVGSDGETVAGSVVQTADDGTDINFLAADVPALGYTVYFAVPADPPDEGELLTDQQLSIQNEYLSLTLDADEGTISVYDKRMGRSYDGLHHLIDGGDAGDLLRYAPPEQDSIISAPTNSPLPVRRRVSPEGQMLQTFQIYRVPQGLTDDRTARLTLAAQFVPLSITTTYTLAVGVPRIDVEIAIANSAEDHRMRVHFPLSITEAEVFVDGHFEVTRIPRDEVPQTALSPQRDFITVQGAESGMTIANRGLPEATIEPDDRGGLGIVLTLLRSVGLLDAESEAPHAVPQAQNIGEYVLGYSLIPHDEEPHGAWALARAFQTPLQAFVVEPHSGMLPPCLGLLEASPEAFVISAVKESEAGIVVRGYNTQPEPLDVVLRPYFTASDAARITLSGAPTEEDLALDEDGIHFTAEAHQVVTVLITPG